MSELEVEASESSRSFGTEGEASESKGKVRDRSRGFGVEREASGTEVEVWELK